MMQVEDVLIALIDAARACGRDGVDAWFDSARWLQGKMEIAPQAAHRYGELVASVVAAQRGRSRKCVVFAEVIMRENAPHFGREIGCAIARIH